MTEISHQEPLEHSQSVPELKVQSPIKEQPKIITSKKPTEITVNEPKEQ
jgi:hypothetical protein